MEEKEGINGSGITVRGDEAPQSYRVESRVENSGNFGGSPAPPVPVPESAPTPTSTASTADGKKKRGRPRKYAADGSIVALSPMPISASIPLTGDFPTWKQSGSRLVESSKKKTKLDFANAGIFCLNLLYWHLRLLLVSS